MSNYPDFSSHGYQIKRQLGQNRLGGRFTYLATNIETQQPVVIKQFQFAQFGASWGEYDAYESEIKMLEQLESPSIPCYLNSFETPTGFCLVQEYKKAPSLAQPRHFTPLEIKQIAIAVLEILVYLQRQRPTVIHRDIKPENILVDRSQRQLKAYLIDFGFARRGSQDLAASSVVKGTLGFMPPEQLFNRQLTKASDLYSLGATLICLLTKTKSLEIGNLIAQDYRIKFKPLVPKLSQQFIDWLSKMTAPSLKERYPNAVVALKALKPIEVVEVDPTQKLLIYVQNLHADFSNYAQKTLESIDVVDRESLSKVLANLFKMSVSSYTIVTQIPPSLKKPLVISITLFFFAEIGTNFYLQNRNISRLLEIKECRECNLQGVNLGQRHLLRANLEDANLKKADLKDTVLSGANLRAANLEGTKLENTKLKNANLVWSNLKNADLKSANLEGARLDNANLKNANLQGANLNGTSLDGTNLKNANLKGAYLEGVNLKYTELEGAIMPNGLKYNGETNRRYRSRN